MSKRKTWKKMIHAVIFRNHELPPLALVPAASFILPFVFVLPDKNALYLYNVHTRGIGGAFFHRNPVCVQLSSISKWQNACWKWHLAFSARNDIWYRVTLYVSFELPALDDMDINHCDRFFRLPILWDHFNSLRRISVTEPSCIETSEPDLVLKFS